MNHHTELHIRDARPNERDAIRDVTLAAYAQYASIMPHWEMYREHVLETLAQDGPAERIVAERDGVIVGSVLLYPAAADVYETGSANASWPEVRLLAVAPAGRGQGVGSALLQECIRRARSVGATTLGLHTEDIMAVAQRMYERAGFVRAPETDFRPVEGALVKGYRLSLA
jgi:GNAT superfamily N-acetyltransferase